MGQGANSKPRVRDDMIVERLPGETLVYDESRDTAHCLGEAAAAVFELCDGTRTRPAVAALAAQRLLGRDFDERELAAVLAELQDRGLLAGEPAGEGISRRQAVLAGGGVVAASLITSIVAPLPAAAQSPSPGPGGNPGEPPLGQTGDPCEAGGDCQSGSCDPREGTDRCCQPPNATCQGNSDCCLGTTGQAFCNSGRCQQAV